MLAESPRRSDRSRRRLGELGLGEPPGQPPMGYAFLTTNPVAGFDEYMETRR
jgi:hypothetical protein